MTKKTKLPKGMTQEKVKCNKLWGLLAIPVVAIISLIGWKVKNRR